MRFIRTTNNIAEFIETNDLTGQIINSMGFQFGEVYFLIKNKKVTFYLNDSEKPFDNFIWSLDIPFTLDDVLIEDADQASAALHNVFNDRFQEQLDELREDLGEEITRSTAKDAEHDAEISALTTSLNNEIDRAISAETQLRNDLNDEIQNRIDDVDAEEARALLAESGITNNLNAEIQNRIADVDAEEARALEAESGITNNLNAEIQNRIADVDAEEARALLAESGITINLNAEIARSTAKDGEHDTQISALTVSLENEISRATEAENALREDLDEEIARAIAVESGLTDALNAEILRSTNKDTEHDSLISGLTDGLDAEIARAISAETILHDDINAERDRALLAESGITIALNNEVVRSTNKDTEHDNLISGLTDGLDAEEARAIAAESGITNNLNNEIQNRIADVDAEEARALEAESGLTIALNNEVVRSTAKDTEHDALISGLTDDLDAEEARAIAAESGLTDALNAEILRSTNKDTEHDSLISDLYATKQNNLTAGKYISISGDVISADSNHVYRLTQAAYDALPEIDLEGLYIITDAQSADLSNYAPLSALTAEVARSTAKDAEHDAEISALTTSITTEVSNRISADNILQTNLTNEVNRAISAETELHNEIINERDRALLAESGLTTGLNDEIQNRINGDNALDVAKADKTSAVASANYDSTNHTILLKNISGTVLSSIDASPFIIDGMVDDVRISGGSLVVIFNTDAGKQDIAIPLTDIFNPSNYYDKTATDTLLAAKLAINDFNSYSGATADKIDDKLEIADFNSYSAITKAEIDSKLATSDFNNYSAATKTSIDSKLAINDFNSYSATTKNDIDNKLASADFNVYSAATNNIIDSISATVETLEDELGDDYYTKSETSGATEIANALNGKQDTLVSTVNIKTINGESVLGSGNIHIESEVSGITSGECQQMIDASIATKQNILTAGTGISIVNDVISVTASSPSVDAYTKAESDAKFATITNFNTHSGDSTVHVTAAEKNTWNGKQNQLTAGTGINISGNTISAKIWSGTQAQYDALATKDNDTIYLIYNS